MPLDQILGITCVVVFFVVFLMYIWYDYKLRKLKESYKKRIREIIGNPNANIDEIWKEFEKI